MSTPCRQHDPDLWFSDHDADKALAMHLCLTHCPLLNTCRDTAKRPAHGVWAGTLYAANGHPDNRGHQPTADGCLYCPAKIDTRQPPTPFPDCGQMKAWSRHNKRGERPCNPCRQINLEAQARRRRDRNQADITETADQRRQQEELAQQRRAERAHTATRVADLAGKGLTDREIGTRLGIPHYTVRRIRRLNHVPAGKTRHAAAA